MAPRCRAEAGTYSRAKAERKKAARKAKGTAPAKKKKTGDDQ